MKPEIAVIGLGLAAGIGALLIARRNSGASTPGNAGGFDSFGGGGSAPMDPWAGQVIDSGTGDAGPMGLSSQAESTIIEDNRRANDQIVRDTRNSLRRVEDNTRFSNAIQAATVTASTVPFALHGLAKYGLRLGRTLARPTFGVAAGATGGVALGLGAVKALDSTGALDSLQRTSSSIARNTSQPVQTAIKTVAQPLSYVGAVATGVVGHGSVAGNLQKAYHGTFTQKSISAARRGLRRLF